LKFYQLTAKNTTGNGYFQPEKKKVLPEYSSTRVLPAVLLVCRPRSAGISTTTA